MSLEARAIVVVLLLVGALAGWHRLTMYYEGRGYARAQAEYQAAAELQREGNRSRARGAEERYTPAAAARDRFIVTTVREIRDVTPSLAACPVGPAGVRLLNDAATCARQDRPASCGAGQPLPHAG